MRNSSTPDVMGTKTTSRRKRNAIRFAGVRRRVNATANSVSKSTSMDVKCASALIRAR